MTSYVFQGYGSTISSHAEGECATRWTDLGHWMGPGCTLTVPVVCRVWGQWWRMRPVWPQQCHLSCCQWCQLQNRAQMTGTFPPTWERDIQREMMESVSHPCALNVHLCNQKVCVYPKTPTKRGLTVKLHGYWKPKWRCRFSREITLVIMFIRAL